MNSAVSFVHLHLHSQYSLLQGTIRMKELFKKASEYRMPAVAMTDVNNLFGAIDFYLTAQEFGIKPILGCELYYAPQGRLTAAHVTTSFAQSARPRFFPIVVLCKNYEGYQNLCKILTQAYLDGSQSKSPGSDLTKGLVDRELLDRFGDQWVVLSGGLKSEASYLYLTQQEEEAQQSLLWFQQRFKDDFYLEIVDSSLPEQEQVNRFLYEYALKNKVRIVGTADCFYLNPADAEAQEILQCIESGRNLDFDRPKSLVPPEQYFKSSELMIERLERYTGAAEATLEIAEKCDLKFQFKDSEGRAIYHLPDYRPSDLTSGETFDLIEYFRQESRQGLKERFEEMTMIEGEAGLQPSLDAPKQRLYEDRLESELRMIEKTGFSGYFMIVADFIQWAKKQGIPVGPGRGSGAGSLVAYCLKITDVDPIEFQLLFERFINPERVSMPDFDIDFCQDRRGEVIEYVERKYGKQNVSQIITFGKLQARAVLKDVGRVLGMPFSETDQLTKLFPNELNIKLSEVYEKEPRLREKIESDVKLGRIWEYSKKLEGLYRNAGIHAAGVIITEHPLTTYCPLYVGRDGDVVTQLDKDFSEKVGLIKFDFLGLKTLTVIENAVQLIRLGSVPGSPESSFEIRRINRRDEKVFALISSGDTNGIFQVESDGMKDLCSRIQPNSLEDLTAINALYRPGPLGSGMVDDFIDRKHGRKEMAYDLPQLEPILKDTYGVILYQEQVMQIARDLAGYTLGQADMLRRAMGKKKPEEMAKQKEIFVAGALLKGILQQKAESIFDLMAKFAEYGFNKSHSAAYGMITYQTAFLKTHFAAEFLAALMTTEMDDTDKISKYIADARNHGIKILPPDVNFSLKKFSVEVTEGVRSIRFGLEAIKGVGGIAVDCIIEARLKQPFQNMLDFCKRASTRKVNKKVMESLVLAGALDQISEVNRPSLLASLEGLLQYASDEQEEESLGQTSLFSAFSADQVKQVIPTDRLYKKESDWPISKKLMNEKQVVGFFISGHPMNQWQSICDHWLGMNVQKLKELARVKSGEDSAPAEGGYSKPKRKEVRLAGLFTEVKEITTKKGSRMAFAQLEDLHGRVEIIFFPEAYLKLADLLKKVMNEAEPVLVTGEFDQKEGEPKVLVQNIESLESIHQGRKTTVQVDLTPALMTVSQLRELKKCLFDYRGKSSVLIRFLDQTYCAEMELPKTFNVQGTPEFAAAINQIFGKTVVHLRESD